MPLEAKERRRLIAEAHHLKAAVTIAADELSDNIVAHVRDLLRQHPLTKVRVATDDRTTCEAVAEELARCVPCDVVTRVGRVVVLHRGEYAQDGDET